MGKIEFVSTVDGLEEIEDCRPRPAKYFIPEWFKNIPSSGYDTVRVCPSFPDFFSQGYIIPMWSDTKLTYDSNLDVWHWKSSADAYKWEIHNKWQFIDHANASFRGVDGNFIFKAVCPWRVITPPGWSVLQLPLFYHFNKQYSILPGIIDTDIHHEVNQQVLYHGNGEEVLLEMGTPFALYIPFKRENRLDYKIRRSTEQDKINFKKQNLYVSSKYIPNGLYRKMQRLRDKK